MRRRTILFVIGTRPEAIKLAPVVLQAQELGHRVHVCLTLQHQSMTKQVLSFFKIKPTHQFKISNQQRPLQILGPVLIEKTQRLLSELKPDWIIVQGDTLSAGMASVASFYSKVPLVHIEAGLRTYDPLSPWPEEYQRRLVSLGAQVHFAPSRQAKMNLLRENIPSRHIYISGNTVVDSLFSALREIDQNQQKRRGLLKQFSFLSEPKKVILITLHRRENIGPLLESYLRELKRLSVQHPDAEFVYILHPNPDVTNSVLKVFPELRRSLVQTPCKCKNIWFLAPMSYIDFIFLLKKAHLVITDSGGLQEEAPALGKPTLVLRKSSERPEPLKSKNTILIGASLKVFRTQFNKLMRNEPFYRSMAQRRHHYGEGFAAQKIMQILGQLDPKQTLE